MALNRRTLLAGGGCAALGALIPLRNLFGRDTPSANAGAWGPLREDPQGILDLPSEFSYRIIDRADRRMTDGYRVPGAFDGMGCFPGADDTLVLMRNHENSWLPFGTPYAQGQPVPPEAYDRAASGCVTRLVLDRRTLELRSSNLALTGTVRNCAGGLSPWGWLSC